MVYFRCTRETPNGPLTNLQPCTLFLHDREPPTFLTTRFHTDTTDGTDVAGIILFAISNIIIRDSSCDATGKH